MVEDTRVILQALARSSFDALMARPGGPCVRSGAQRSGFATVTRSRLNSEFFDSPDRPAMI